MNDSPFVDGRSGGRGRAGGERREKEKEGGREGGTGVWDIQKQRRFCAAESFSLRLPSRLLSLRVFTRSETFSLPSSLFVDEKSR